MRKIMALFLLLNLLWLGSTAEAQVFIRNQEVSRPTGTIWGYPGNEVSFVVEDLQKAEVFTARNGEQRLRLKRPGDVMVKAIFYESSGDILEYHILFHVTGQAVDETAVDRQSFARDVLELVNEERQKRHLEPLRLAQDLNDAAMIRAEECVRYFSHTRPDGSSFHTVMRNPYRMAGENLSAGRPTAKATVDAWMDSPGHRDNILNPDYRELGVGYIYAANSRYHHYWVQLFRR